MASGQKYHIDPKLVASIVIVESGADPFAVSTAESVGIMQIHLPTWGRVADKENINLLRSKTMSISASASSAVTSRRGTSGGVLAAISVAGTVWNPAGRRRLRSEGSAHLRG
jgi:hypothetical protein